MLPTIHEAALLSQSSKNFQGNTPLWRRKDLHGANRVKLSSETFSSLQFVSFSSLSRPIFLIKSFEEHVVEAMTEVCAITIILHSKREYEHFVS